MVNFQDAFTKLYKRFFVLSRTLFMAGEQWISGFVWHQNIMVTQYQPRAMSFGLTWHNLITLMSLMDIRLSSYGYPSYSYILGLVHQPSPGQLAFPQTEAVDHSSLHKGGMTEITG